MRLKFITMPALALSVIAAAQPATPSFVKLRKRAQNSGHRNRLRARLLEAGPQALPDYELLELLLFFSIDVKDTKPCK